MNNKEKLIEKELKDIDQALRRAAQTAKKLSNQHGTPLVITGTKVNSKVISQKSENIR
jgi:hypothetical protein